MNSGGWYRDGVVLAEERRSGRGSTLALLGMMKPMGYLGQREGGGFGEGSPEYTLYSITYL